MFMHCWALHCLQTRSLALTKASLFNDETNARHAIMLAGLDSSEKQGERREGGAMFIAEGGVR